MLWDKAPGGRGGPKDITDLSIILAAHMIHIGGVEKTFEKSLKRALEVVATGEALEEFRKLIKSQGGWGLEIAIGSAPAQGFVVAAAGLIPVSWNGDSK